MSLDNLSRILPKGMLLPVPVIGRMVVHGAMERIAGESRGDFLKRAREMAAGGLQADDD